MNERQLDLDLSPRRAAVAYTRSSTLKQKFSIEVQRIQISEWAARENVSIVSWHEDVGVSGAKRMSKRPGMTEALNFLSATGAQFLVVSHADRLARNVDAANEIEVEVKRLGASVVRTEQIDLTGAYGDLVQGMSRALADYRRAILQNE